MKSIYHERQARKPNEDDPKLGNFGYRIHTKEVEAFYPDNPSAEGRNPLPALIYLWSKASGAHWEVVDAYGEAKVIRRAIELYDALEETQ